MQNKTKNQKVKKIKKRSKKSKADGKFSKNGILFVLHFRTGCTLSSRERTKEKDSNQQ